MKARTAQSLAAEAGFRARLAELGAELLESGWLGSARPHRVRCPVGHNCQPRPDSVKQGQGICRACAGNDPLMAAAAFRERLAARGATLLEPVWLGPMQRHHVRCAAGHDCYPRPDSVRSGGGPCRTCSRRDPALAEAAFRHRLAELGGTLLETQWLGANQPHRVRCAAGHECNSYPRSVRKGLGICLTCAGQDPATSEAAFRAALAAAGAELLEPYRNSGHPHRIRCAAGHEGRTRPGVVQRGFGVCRDCAYRTWDVFYVVAHQSGPRVKFGISNLSGHARLRTHRRSGYATLVRLATGLPGTMARDTENAVRAALAMAGERPVQGREYFSSSCLAVILDVTDSWLSDCDSMVA